MILSTITHRLGINTVLCIVLLDQNKTTKGVFLHHVLRHRLNDRGRKTRSKSTTNMRQDEQRTAENDMTHGPTALHHSYIRGSEST